jgi:hypothetical protein
MNPQSSFDLSIAFQIAMSIAAFLFGWFVRVLFQRIDRLEVADEKLTAAINEMRVDLPQHYVAKSDFRQMGDNIFEALRRIEDKLDKKVDK